MGIVNIILAIKELIKLIWTIYKWSKEQKKLILLIFIFIAIPGCSTLEQQNISPKKPLYNYKADMKIEIGEENFDGVAVTKLEDKIIFKITSKAKLDVLVISSCQRYDKLERLDRGWFGGSGKQYKYTYVPSPTEKQSGCSIYLQAFDKTGLTDWGYISFTTDQKLTAISECSGSIKKYIGHSICQVKTGFEQAISFDVPIKAYSADSNCNIVRKSDKEFSYRPGIGFCIAEFSDGKNFHSLTVLGFDEIFIRGE